MRLLLTAMAGSALLITTPPASASVTPLPLASVVPAPVRLASVRLAPVRLASVRLASVSLASAVPAPVLSAFAGLGGPVKPGPASLPKSTVTVKLSPSAPIVAEPWAVTGRVGPSYAAEKRTVTAQRWSGKKWATVGRATSNSWGDYRIAMPKPTSTAAVSLRVVVTKSKKWAGVTSAKRVVKAQPALKGPFVVANGDAKIYAVESAGSHRPKQLTTGWAVGAARGWILYQSSDFSDALYILSIGGTARKIAQGTGSTCLISPAFDPSGRYAAWITGRSRTLGGGFTGCFATSDVRLFTTATGVVTAIPAPTGLAATSIGTANLTFTPSGYLIAENRMSGTLFVHDPRTHQWTTPHLPPYPAPIPADIPAPAGHIAVSQVTDQCPSGLWLTPVDTPTPSSDPSPTTKPGTSTFTPSAPTSTGTSTEPGSSTATCTTAPGTTGYRHVSPDGTRTVWTTGDRVIVGDATFTPVRDLGAVPAKTRPRFVGNNTVAWTVNMSGTVRTEIRPLPTGSAWKLLTGWQAAGMSN